MTKEDHIVSPIPSVTPPYYKGAQCRKSNYIPPESKSPDPPAPSVGSCVPYANIPESKPLTLVAKSFKSTFKTKSRRADSMPWPYRSCTLNNKKLALRHFCNPL